MSTAAFRISVMSQKLLLTCSVVLISHLETRSPRGEGEAGSDSFTLIQINVRRFLVLIHIFVFNVCLFVALLKATCAETVHIVLSCLNINPSQRLACFCLFS